MTNRAHGDRADNPRTGGAREQHNKPQRTEPPGVRVKGSPAETAHRTEEHGTPPEKRSGVNVDPAARK